MGDEQQREVGGTSASECRTSYEPSEAEFKALWEILVEVRRYPQEAQLGHYQEHCTRIEAELTECRNPRTAVVLQSRLAKLYLEMAHLAGSRDEAREYRARVLDYGRQACYDRVVYCCLCDAAREQKWDGDFRGALSNLYEASIYVGPYLRFLESLLCQIAQILLESSDPRSAEEVLHEWYIQVSFSPVFETLHRHQRLARLGRKSVTLAEAERLTEHTCQGLARQGLALWSLRRRKAARPLLEEARELARAEGKTLWVEGIDRLLAPPPAAPAEPAPSRAPARDPE